MVLIEVRSGDDRPGQTASQLLGYLPAPDEAQAGDSRHFVARGTLPDRVCLPLEQVQRWTEDVAANRETRRQWLAWQAGATPIETLRRIEGFVEHTGAEDTPIETLRGMLGFAEHTWILK